MGGPCNTVFERYHYANGAYTVNGCAEANSEDDPKPGRYCAVKACKVAGTSANGRSIRKLPVFDPPSNKAVPDATKPY